MGLQVVEAHPLFPYFLEKRLAIPTPPFFIYKYMLFFCYQRVRYVGLARTAPPTNTNFRLTFLLTRIQEALYEDLDI